MPSGNGDVESLWGRLNPHDFGSRVEREKAPINQMDHKTSERVEWDFPSTNKSKVPDRRRKNLDEFDWQIYKPKSKETQSSFELFLSFLQEFVLMDQPRDVIKSAADELLLILKDEKKKDVEKKKESELILGPIEMEQFDQLGKLSEKLTDFVMPSGEAFYSGNVDKDPVGKNIEIAVDFSDQEESDDEDQMESENEQEESGSNLIQLENTNELNNANLLDQLDLHKIDFIWFQNIFSVHYSDSQASHLIATQVLKALEMESELRECENSLVDILEFDKFDLIKFLLDHRVEIVNCIKLSSYSDSSERCQFENYLRSFLEGRNLLARYNAPKNLSTELDKPSIAMDVDKDNLVVSPEENLQTLDIENMSFTQGNHLMTNKKCKLPEKSVKITKRIRRNSYSSFATRTNRIRRAFN